MDRPLDTEASPRKLPEPDTSVLPSFVLIAPPPPTRRFPPAQPHQSLCDAWRTALADLPPSLATLFTVKEARLDPPSLAQEFGTFECVVSPANSFGIMDGGYDLALTRAFVVGGDLWALTNTVQDALRAKHRGYLPPGSCALVPLSPELTASNELGTTVIAVLPTMRTPEDVSWNVDIVYDGMWNLLSAIWRWNSGDRPPGATEIRRVLMTGLGTGYGCISFERCAKQMCLAALNFARGWGERPRWNDVAVRAAEMNQTRKLP